MWQHGLSGGALGSHWLGDPGSLSSSVRRPQGPPRPQGSAPRSLGPRRAPPPPPNTAGSGLGAGTRWGGGRGTAPADSRLTLCCHTRVRADRGTQPAGKPGTRLAGWWPQRAGLAPDVIRSPAGAGRGHQAGNSRAPRPAHQPSPRPSSRLRPRPAPRSWPVSGTVGEGLGLRSDLGEELQCL